jgi:RNA polymerase sigma factor (TIGR02999 family)
MENVTQILSAIEQGNPQAAEQLLPLVYEELRKLAAQKMARETPDQTLQATALVHEAYLRLVGGAAPVPWNSRGHFFAAAAEAMRRILIDRARHKQGQGQRPRQRRRELTDGDLLANPVSDDLLDLDEALSKLAQADPQAGELVKLRVFAGMTVEEIAQFQGVSPRTVKRSWAYARAWLGRALADYAASDS